MISLREAHTQDFEGIWKIIEPVIKKGDTYAFEPGTTKGYIRDYWMNADKKTYVALEGEEIVGSYLLKENQPGLGSHVCNAAFVVATEKRGKGIGKQMGEHALREAKRSGYKAMQFNFVISTNTVAIELWKSLGFKIIGQVPEGFRHQQKGMVDAFIMHRFL